MFMQPNGRVGERYYYTQESNPENLDDHVHMRDMYGIGSWYKVIKYVEYGKLPVSNVLPDINHQFVDGVEII